MATFSSGFLHKVRSLFSPLSSIYVHCLFGQYMECTWHYCHSSSKHLPFPVLRLQQLTDTGQHQLNRDSFLVKEEWVKSAFALSLSGGGQKAVERHRQQKKMMVEERLKAVLDEDSSFLELSPLAGFMMEYGSVPRAGILTGIGSVSGKVCMLLVSDGTVKGGTVFPIGVKKQLRAQEIAEQNRLPCVYIIDSGGAFLPLQAEIFPDKYHGGRVFYNEAVMGASQIPQVVVVCGSCTAGGAYIPTMADDAIIVHRTGSVFLGGPPLVKAAIGEIISAEDLGGATVHCSVSGCTDYFAEDENSAYETCRDIIFTLNVGSGLCPERIAAQEPLFDAADLPSLIPADNQHAMDLYQIIARVMDGSRFHEFKKLYGSTMITGFAYIDGYQNSVAELCFKRQNVCLLLSTANKFLVGIVGNQGAITADAASKGAHFVSMCTERNVPLIFLQNTMPSLTDEEDGDQIKCQARMMGVVSCCAVPKITVVVGNAIGTGHYVMAGKSMSPNFLFSWPNAVRCIDSPDNVAQVVEGDVRQAVQDDGEAGAMMSKFRERLTMETTAVFASSRLLDDGVIYPQDTRHVLSQCLNIVTAYRQRTTSTFPVIRM